MLVLLIGVARFRANAKANALRAGANLPLAVTVARVATADVPITIDALGTVTPLATVTVHPQVNGPITKINFTEGQMLKAGALLAEIDARPFKAAVDQAKGQLDRDTAMFANAKIDLARYKTLLAENSVSEQQYATQQATVDQDEGTVAADVANLEAAQLNLDYCRVTTPVAGLVGLRQVDVGNLVQANSTEIAVVTQMQPMSVLFTVPEDSLGSILQRLRSGQKLAVDAYDRSLTNKIASGVLSNADNEIDPTTGTLKLRAMFDNAKLELFPNQFVNVHLLLDTVHNAIVVPGSGLQQGASGSYVYVANADNTVTMRAVTTGPGTADQVSILKGLQPGETVVVDGADQLRDGAHITIPQAGAAGAAAAQRPRRAGSGSQGSSSGGGQHYQRQQGSSTGTANSP
ncbi:MAG TPA: efflux RND transporter periplasmic adaptor subunit [Steroidobacteraceae bacterium]